MTNSFILPSNIRTNEAGTSDWIKASKNLTIKAYTDATTAGTEFDSSKKVEEKPDSKKEKSST